MGEIIDESSDLAHNKSPQINLNTIIPSHTKVHGVGKFDAEDEHLLTESVRLTSRGKTQHYSKNGEAAYTQLADDDSFVVAVRPKSEEEESEDDDLKFELPESASRWKRRLFYVLHDKLKFPDIVLMAIFSLSVKAWVFTIVWFMLAPVAHRWEFGRLFIIATGFALIFMNLGRRKQGELSAYSIFNKDFRELPGTFNADRIDRDIRAGQLSGTIYNLMPV
ncbi:hypothetical protein RND81_06G219800 [Saponaria officinalis]|uniref:SAYSvFN domain-containing protein n=1 Tax=Saponaria officinalis TaxID=3572 RepID=A0AAW1KEF8_SAPOF